MNCLEIIWVSYLKCVIYYVITPRDHKIMFFFLIMFRRTLLMRLLRIQLKLWSQKDSREVFQTSAQDVNCDIIQAHPTGIVNVYPKHIVGLTYPTWTGNTLGSPTTSGRGRKMNRQKTEYIMCFPSIFCMTAGLCILVSLFFYFTDMFAAPQEMPFINNLPIFRNQLRVGDCNHNAQCI